MLSVTSLGTFYIKDRRADAIPSPFEFATNDPTCGGLMNALVEIDGGPVRKIVGVERYMHATPVRKGEHISILTELIL